MQNKIMNAFECTRFLVSSFPLLRGNEGLGAKKSVSPGGGETQVDGDWGMGLDGMLEGDGSVG